MLASGRPIGHALHAALGTAQFGRRGHHGRFGGAVRVQQPHAIAHALEPSGHPFRHGRLAADHHHPQRLGHRQPFGPRRRRSTRARSRVGTVTNVNLPLASHSCQNVRQSSMSSLRSTSVPPRVRHRIDLFHVGVVADRGELQHAIGRP